MLSKVMKNKYKLFRYYVIKKEYNTIGVIKVCELLFICSRE